jgi:hypothetical protein
MGGCGDTLDGGKSGVISESTGESKLVVRFRTAFESAGGGAMLVWLSAVEERE